MVHSCLQLRLIRYEWGASFFDVGASLKNCSCCLKEQSHASSLALEWTNCLWVGKISSHKKSAFKGNVHQRYCPLWVAVFETCSKHMVLLPRRAHLYHYNTCVVVVHSCLQLRLIRHEWGISFFDMGASLKNCSCRLKEQSRASPSALEQTNCLRVGKISSHKLN